MQETAKVLNQIYYRLEMKSMELLYALQHRIFSVEMRYYSGHYNKNEAGDYVQDYYPIPVISVKDFCDIEVYPDRISVTTKLKRKDALSYSFEKMKKYPFEAYGVEDYLSDYYHEGQSFEELKENILSSDEREIGFSFSFDFDVEKEKIFEFVKLLRREHFYLERR